MSDLIQIYVNYNLNYIRHMSDFIKNKVNYSLTIKDTCQTSSGVKIVLIIV